MIAPLYSIVTRYCQSTGRKTVHCVAWEDLEYEIHIRMFLLRVSIKIWQKMQTCWEVDLRTTLDKISLGFSNKNVFLPKFWNISGNPIFGGRTHRGLSKWYPSHVRTTQCLRKNGQAPKLQKHGITFVWQKFAIVLIKIWDFSQSNHYWLICLPT